jgi:hypothetical protein
MVVGTGPVVGIGLAVGTAYRPTAMTSRRHMPIWGPRWLTVVYYYADDNAIDTGSFSYFKKKLKNQFFLFLFFFQFFLSLIFLFDFL